MNTALIGHIMNQRLRKGEIWPSWWDRKWTWSMFWPVASFWFFLQANLRWTIAPRDPVSAVGRAIYLVGIFAIIVQSMVLAFQSFQPRLRRELEGPNLQLLLLAHGTPFDVLITWFSTDLTTLLLRLMRYVPLIAIAAVADGITWGNAASFTFLMGILACTLLALLYAATITDARNHVAESAVVVAIGVWLYLNVNFNVSKFGAFFYDGLWRHLPTLLVAACLAIAWATVALTLRVQWSGRRGARVFRLRLPVLPLLKRWPHMLLLRRGLRSALGGLGSSPAMAAVALAGLGIGMVPYAGAILLLFAIMIAVPFLLTTARRTGAWDDVFLASDSNTEWNLLDGSDAKNWTATVSWTCCLACVAALPGLAVHAVLARYSTGGGWSAIMLGHNVATESGNPVLAAAVGAFVFLAAVVCATALFIAVVITTLEGFISRAMRASGPWAGSAGTYILALMAPFLAFSVLYPLYEGIETAVMTALWLSTVYVVATLVVILITIVSYRNLCQLMEHAAGLTSSDFERARAGKSASDS